MERFLINLKGFHTEIISKTNMVLCRILARRESSLSFYKNIFSGPNAVYFFINLRDLHTQKTSLVQTDLCKLKCFLWNEDV